VMSDPSHFPLWLLLALLLTYSFILGCILMLSEACFPLLLAPLALFS
jgi:hypothetical protein